MCNDPPSLDLIEPDTDRRPSPFFVLPSTGDGDFCLREPFFFFSRGDDELTGSTGCDWHPAELRNPGEESARGCPCCERGSSSGAESEAERRALLREVVSRAEERGDAAPEGEAEAEEMGE